MAADTKPLPGAMLLFGFNGLSTRQILCLRCAIRVRNDAFGLFRVSEPAPVRRILHNAFARS